MCVGGGGGGSRTGNGLTTGEPRVKWKALMENDRLTKVGALTLLVAGGGGVFIHPSGFS